MTITGVASKVASTGGVGTISASGYPNIVSFSSAVSPAGGSFSASGNLSLPPPSGYQPGDTLLMSVIAGSASGAVYPTAPTGWIQLTSASSVFGVWEKTAGVSEPSVNFSLGSGVCLSGQIVAYRMNVPGRIVLATPLNVAVSSVAGSAGNLSFTGTMPSVNGMRTVLVAANQGWGASGWNHVETQGEMYIMMPPASAGWSLQAPPISSTQFEQTALGVMSPAYNVCLGLSDYPGVPSVAPTVTSVQDASFWTAIFGLTESVIGAGAAVTAQGGAGCAYGYGAGAIASAQGGTGTPSGGANASGTAAVAANGGAGTLSGGVSVSGAGTAVAATGGPGALSGQQNIAGTAAIVTATGGAGTPFSVISTNTTGVAAASMSQGGAGIPGVNVTGVGALVTAQAGAGTTGVSVEGVSATVNAQGGAGSSSTGEHITGVGASVNTVGGAGTSFGNISINTVGIAAAVMLAAGAGTPGVGINTTGTASVVTAFGGSGTLSGGAGILGTGAEVAVLCGVGILVTAGTQGVAALVTAEAGAGTFSAPYATGILFHVAWNVAGYGGQTQVELVGSDMMKQMV